MMSTSSTARHRSSVQCAGRRDGQPILECMTGRILTGTASWTDPSLIATGRFYPAGVTTAEQRLRFYASVFPLVEVDSTYYGLPRPHVVDHWVERTPPGFTFNVKALSLLTHHPTPPGALPREARTGLEPSMLRARYVYQRDVPHEAVDLVWRRFEQALAPLAAAGKLGVVLFQFPPWFVPGPEAFAYLAQLGDRLPHYRLAVEFRAPPWLAGRQQALTLALLREHGLSYVCVDEPQHTHASVPPVSAFTAAPAVVRMHGRNQVNWARRDVPAAAKYDYLYAESELRGWLPAVRQLAEEAGEVHVVMNNCREDKAVVNARQLASLLGLQYPARASREPRRPAQAQLF